MSASKNRTKLALYKAAIDAVPVGGGIEDGIAFFQDPERMKSMLKAAYTWVDAAVLAVRSAPDNPYGTDEEIIGAILEELEKAKLTQRVKIEGPASKRGLADKKE